MKLRRLIELISLRLSLGFKLLRLMRKTFLLAKGPRILLVGAPLGSAMKSPGQEAAGRFNGGDVRSIACRSGKKYPAWRPAGGFTLLEVMVAMAIIAIGLTALLGSHSQSISLAEEANFNTTAALLAQKKMAELELAGFGNLSYDTGDFGEEFPGYRWEVKVSRPNIGGSDDMAKYIKQIDLSLSRGEGSRNTYTLKLYHFAPES